MKFAGVSGVLLILCVLNPYPAARSRQSSAPVLPLPDLTAPGWEQRRAAYEKIKGNEEAMKRSDVKAALLDLLDRENQMGHKTLVDSKGKQGSDKYGEGYDGYVSELLGTVIQTADWHDPHQLCVLAHSGYNPDRLVAEGGAALAPCLLEMAQGHMYGQYDPVSVRDSYDRFQAIPMLVHLSAVAEDLSPSIRQQIREVTIASLRGDSRLVIILALKKFGTPELIPILQEIARSDPYSRIMDNGQRRFDVREAAKDAIRSIQERANASQ